MTLVAPGGLYIAASPGNNQMGHGFYQFSPEFFFRAIDAESHFRVERLLAVEQRMWRSRWFDVRDPAESGRRYQLRSNHPVELFLQARCLLASRESEPLIPQQSDYVVAWEKGSVPRRSFQGRIRDSLPPSMIRLVEPLARYRKTSWSNGGFRRLRSWEID